MDLWLKSKLISLITISHPRVAAPSLVLEWLQIRTLSVVGEINSLRGYRLDVDFIEWTPVSFIHRSRDTLNQPGECAYITYWEGIELSEVGLLRQVFLVLANCIIAV